MIRAIDSASLSGLPVFAGFLNSLKRHSQFEGIGLAFLMP